MKAKKIMAVAVSFAMAAALIPAVPVSVDAAGKAEITLKNGKKAPKQIFVGKKYKLAVKDEKVEFSLKKGNAVTISKNVITAVAPGKAKLVAKNESGKVVAKKKFVVLSRAKKINLDQTDITLAAGETAKISATIAPEDSTDVLSYETSNKKVATVDVATGAITAVSQGTAKITVYAKATKKTKNKNKKNVKAVVTVTVTGSGSAGGAEETVLDLIPEDNFEKSAELLSATSIGFILPKIKPDVSKDTVSVIAKKDSSALKIKDVKYSAAGTGIVEFEEALKSGEYTFYYKKGVNGEEIKIAFEYEEDEDEETGSSEDGAIECDIAVYVGSTDVTNKSVSLDASTGLNVTIKFDPADYDDSGDGEEAEEDDGSDDDEEDEEDTEDTDDTTEPDEPETEGTFGYNTWSKYYAIVCVDGEAEISSGTITTKTDSASFVVLDKNDSITISYFTLTK